MIKRLSMWFVCIGLMLIVITACSGNNSGDTNTPDNSSTPENSNNENEAVEPPEDNEPEKGVDVEATIFMYSVHGTTDEAFNELWGDKLRDRFPLLTIEFLQNSAGNSIQDLVARGQVPDIMRTAFNTLYADYIDLGLAYDMQGLFDEDGYDLSVFEPSLMTRIYNEAPNGELYGVPISGSTNGMAMFYNKGIFDRFGIDHPTDDMTWDEVYELARQLARTEDGVEYKAFSGRTPNVLRYNQPGLPFLDPEEDKIFDMDQWVPVFNNYLRFYELDNNEFPESLPEHYTGFKTNMNVAMHVENYGEYRSFPEELDWDVMAMPKLEGVPQNNGGLGAAYWSITEQAEDKELAYEVIKFLSSQEVQVANARMGYIPSIVDEEVYSQFGMDDPKLEGKNIDGFFANGYAPAPIRRDPSLMSFSEGDQANIFRDVLVNVAQNKMDLNTAIREAEELFEQQFQEAAVTQAE